MALQWQIRRANLLKIGGEGGIRTPGTRKRTTDFESAAFDHSATSPVLLNQIVPFVLNLMKSVRVYFGAYILTALQAAGARIVTDVSRPRERPSSSSAGTENRRIDETAAHHSSTSQAGNHGSIARSHAAPLSPPLSSVLCRLRAPVFGRGCSIAQQPSAVTRASSRHHDPS